MKQVRVGIFNRYWNVFGGGERHVGAVAAQLSANPGFDVCLIGTEPFEVAALAGRFSLDLSRCRAVVWPDPEFEQSALTRDYDLFINSTHYSMLPSASARSLYFCFFPRELPPDDPYTPRSFDLLRRLFLRRAPAAHWLDTYDLFVANSEFTAGWIRRRWSKRAVVLPPPIDTAVFTPPAPGEPRKQVILSVGRFFAEGHNKKHDVMIRVFRTMIDRGLLPRTWKLVLAGSRHTEKASHLAYYDNLLSLARGYPVEFAPDIPFQGLLELYRTSSIYWHAAGFGESEEETPERFEHFGITTCEAMACGLVPVVIDSAGQRGLVAEGRTGYTFHTEEQLIEKTLVAIRDVDSGRAETLRGAAVASVRAYSPAVFRRRVRRIFGG
jgi:glycosyltransferase involved in cell wall biosynthesis